MSHRSHRLAEELKNEISAIIAQEVKDPRVGFATVTEVEVSPDLRHARVLVSVLGSPEEKREAFEALAGATGYIRHLVGARVRLRHTPELSFVYDDSIERGDQMMRLFDEINSEKTPDET
ncbi:MAG TPA: 30S ribosome-binding factor RbfA [Blastocatellia bacterium]|nr:30S ribosome-binding factor RbfA [Blastocatellia bacterium]